MNFTFKVNVDMDIDVTNVNSAEHAVNRLKKYLRSAIVMVATCPGSYTPDGDIVLTFNEHDIIDSVDTDDIINPPTWFSEKEKQSIIDAAVDNKGVTSKTLGKLIDVLDKEE